MITRTFLYCCMLALTLFGCTCTPNAPAKDKKPLRADWPTVVKNAKPGTVFKENEIIVFYKGSRTQEKEDSIKAVLKRGGMDTATIDIRKCTTCGSPIELWKAAGIHSVINTEGVRGGSGGDGSKGVGEDSLARYSVNFISEIPVDTLFPFARYRDNYKPSTVSVAGKDTIIIAVLDTGIDPQFISSADVWKNRSETFNGFDEDNNCYQDDINGWNFANNTPDIRDDNTSLHGSVVSQYIINQFETSAANTLQIMALKTHDDTGHGDLFSTMCALYYAMDKGANIINASWGFYNYGDSPVPFLDSVITKVLPTKGILFVTAAGNKNEADDQLAKNIYSTTHGGATIPEADLRNLEIHNFYPACLSTENNNVFVVTTTDGIITSPTQNYSDKYVDLGIKADSVTSNYMKFKSPFVLAQPIYISGSSFATAIASGKIGANLKKVNYIPGMKKGDVFSSLPSNLTVLSTPLDTAHLIKKGKYYIP